MPYRRLLVQRVATGDVIDVIEPVDDAQAEDIKRRFGSVMHEVRVPVFQPGTPFFARVNGRVGPDVAAVLLEDRSTSRDFDFVGLALINGVPMKASLDPLHVRRAFVVFDVAAQIVCKKCRETIIAQQSGAQSTRVYLVEDDAHQLPAYGRALLAPTELSLELRCAKDHPSTLTLSDGVIDFDSQLPHPSGVLYAKVLTVNGTAYTSGA